MEKDSCSEEKVSLRDSETVKAHLHRRAVTVYRAVRKIERVVFYGDVYTWSGRTARLTGKPLGLEV